MNEPEAVAERVARAYLAGSRAAARLTRTGEVDNSGGLLRIATGSRVPFLSWLYITGDDVSIDALADAVAWFDARRQPFAVRLRAAQVPRYHAALAALEWTPFLQLPALVASPIPTVPAPAVGGLVITRVADRPAYDAFTLRVAPGGPSGSMTTQDYRDFMTFDVVEDPTTVLLLGTVDGAPVANAAARIDEGVLTVFAVGTAEAMRRRGIGAAMTGAALDWGRAAGADLAFLTTSEMADSLYRSLGFVEADTWHFYLRPGDGLPGHAPAQPR